jgi:hypothetical protein
MGRRIRIGRVSWDGKGLGWERKIEMGLKDWGRIRMGREYERMDES